MGGRPQANCTVELENVVEGRKKPGQMTDDPYKAPEHQPELTFWTWRTKSSLVACLILSGTAVITWRLTGTFVYGVIMWALFGLSVLAGKLFGTPSERD